MKKCWILHGFHLHQHNPERIHEKSMKLVLWKIKVRSLSSSTVETDDISILILIGFIIHGKLLKTYSLAGFNYACKIWDKHLPNSSMIMHSPRQSEYPRFSASSACTRRQVHVAFTSSQDRYLSLTEKKII